jgi:hypothetical protein
MDREDAWTFAELKDMKVLSTDKGEIKTVKISTENQLKLLTKLF